jgi:hypothetical protein
MHLMTPSPKAEQRLFRQALLVVAEGETNYDRVSIENDYMWVRTGLVHLHHDDYFGVFPLNKIDDLLKLDAELLALLKGASYWTAERIAALEKAGDNLAKVARDAQKELAIQPEQLRLFFLVIEELVRQYEREGFKATGIIDPNVMILAHKVAENFPAYDATLNYRLPEAYQGGVHGVAA